MMFLVVPEHDPGIQMIIAVPANPETDNIPILESPEDIRIINVAENKTLRILLQFRITAIAVRRTVQIDDSCNPDQIEQNQDQNHDFPVAGINQQKGREQKNQTTGSQKDLLQNRPFADILVAELPQRGVTIITALADSIRRTPYLDTIGTKLTGEIRQIPELHRGQQPLLFLQRIAELDAHRDRLPVNSIEMDFDPADVLQRNALLRAPHVIFQEQRLPFQLSVSAIMVQIKEKCQKFQANEYGKNDPHGCTCGKYSEQQQRYQQPDRRILEWMKYGRRFSHGVR